MGFKSTSVYNLSLSSEIVVILIGYGHDTIGSLRKDLSWYDSPELSADQVDAIREAVGLSKRIIRNRFTTR